MGDECARSRDELLAKQDAMFAADIDHFNLGSSILDNRVTIAIANEHIAIQSDSIWWNIAVAGTDQLSSAGG